MEHHLQGDVSLDTIHLNKRRVMGSDLEVYTIMPLMGKVSYYYKITPRFQGFGIKYTERSSQV